MDNGLCPSYYLSTQILNWDAMVNMTKVKLVLIPDPYLFFQKCIRVTVSYISK